MAQASADFTLLAIDTATEFCSVALWHRGRLTARTERVDQSHSAVLLPWIDDMLRASGLTPAALGGVAFGAGPGSFTGLRIACGVAQGLAWGVQCRVVPVGNLEALATIAAGDRATPVRVACAIDARMREAYWAVYDVTADDVIEIAAPALSAATALADVIAPFAPTIVAGNALGAFADVFHPGAAQALPAARVDATAVARCALRHWRAGRAVAPADARPLYVRNRVAQTVAERTQARAAGVS